jgi:hypothetical protein
MDENDDRRLIQHAMLMLCKDDTAELFRDYGGSDVPEPEALVRYEASGRLPVPFRDWLAGRLGRMTQDLPERYELALVAA